MTTFSSCRRVQAGMAARVALILTTGALAACSTTLNSAAIGDATPSPATADVSPATVGDKLTDAQPPSPSVSSQPPQTLAELARAHAADPRNPLLALSYARALKKAGKRLEALATLDTAVTINPADQILQIEQGLLALELGQTKKAATVLKAAAESPIKDWRVLSGLGVAESSLGRQKIAQRYFTQALELSPNNPAVLNNMAMSLILERKIAQAEALLQRASKDGAQRQQVSQNLALTKVLKSEGFTDSLE